MKNNQKKYTCCLCGGKFEEYGNNPYPLAGGRCCNACDWNYVVPVRELMLDLDEKYQLDETPYDRLKRLLKEYGF